MEPVAGLPWGMFGLPLEKAIMESEDKSNALFRIGLFAGSVALLAAGVAHHFDEGIVYFLAMASAYVFGVNAILLLGYELQERTSGLLRRS